MEAFAFELKLIDSVSATSKKAAKAVEAVESSAKKASKALDFGSELEKAEHQLKRLKFDPVGYKKLINAQKELSEQRKKLGKESFFEAFKEKIGFGKMVGAAFLGDLLAESLVEGAKSAVEFLTEGIKKAFEAGAKSENLRLGAKLTLGKGAGEFNEDVTRFSKLTGFDDDAIKGMLLPMRRAGFNQKGARSAFAIAADLAAGNGKGGDQGFVSGILDTLTDIKLKGGVGEKRLVSMGINAPQFYKSLAKTQGTSVEGAKKLAEGGKIDPQLLINLIGKQVEQQQGGKLGTGAIAYSKTFEARATKLANLPEEYLKAVSESPAWEALTEKMGKALEMLDPDSPRGKRIVDSLVKAFGKLTDAIGRALTPENIDKFASGVEMLVSKLSDLPGIFDKLVTVSEVLATIWAGSKIVGAVSSLTTAMPALASSAGSAVAVVGTLGAPLLAVAAAAGSVGIAIARIKNTADELGGWDRVTKDFKDWVSGEKPAVANDTVNQNSPQWKKDRAAGKGVHVNAPMVVHINGADEDAGQKVAADVHRNMVSAHERAAQEGG